MSSTSESFFKTLLSVWSSGGWVMLPLFALAVFIYHTALKLFLHLRSYSLMRAKIYRFSDSELLAEIKQRFSVLKQHLLPEDCSKQQIRRHFAEMRSEYLPIIDRRIRFLAIITSVGPLLGLLGTVSGMLTTFSGMVHRQSSPFETIVQGISEALITTQTGLLVSIPAIIALSLIIQNRNRLERSIARLEYINLKLIHFQSVSP